MYLEIYGFIAQNKELLRFFYSAIIAIICFIIVVKTDRLFRISFHQGIRYFRNAFLFYGIAFIFRYLVAKPIYFISMIYIFEFFIIMAGFFLLYSLLWKRFETKPSTSSLLNSKIFIFYILAIIIASLDLIWGRYTFMFISQIILFGFASLISYKNYINNKKHKFRRSYLIVMILSFAAWTLNFIFANLLKGRLRFLTNVYALNVIVFLTFLYGVIKLTKRSK
tara:strand:+ start:1991 stop:2659 length:669 start_codon:yes stop_codon:yes gene_type:complete